MWTPDLILITAIKISFVAGVPALVMWLVGRFIGRRAAMVIGFLTIAAVVFLMRYVYLILDTYRICSAPGNFVIFGTVYCHSPGVLDHYLDVWLAGPVAVALILAAISIQYRQFRRQRQF